MGFRQKIFQEEVENARQEELVFELLTAEDFKKLVLGRYPNVCADNLDQPIEK